MQTLDGDGAAETGLAEQPPEVHRGHSAPCDAIAQRVASDDTDVILKPPGITLQGSRPTAPRRRTRCVIAMIFAALFAH